MKIFKYTALAAAALFAGFAFSSCESQDEYVVGAQSNGVYFSTTAPNTVNLEKSSTEFSFEVNRSGQTSAATYALTTKSNAPEGAFNVPAQVVFAEGQEVAKVTVPCSVSNYADKSFNFAITVGDSTTVCTYGNSTYKFTVNVAAAWTDWEPYAEGTCTWFYDLGFAGKSGPDPDLPINVRKNAENPDQWQFWIEHWRSNVDLFMDYDAKTGDITIPVENRNPTGQIINSEYDLYICDLRSYAIATDQYSSKFDHTATFDPTTGFFELAVAYYSVDAEGLMLWKGSYGVETCQVGEYKDYSVDLTYKGYLTAPNEDMFAVFNANVADGCAVAKVLMSTKSAQNILQDILNGAEGVAELMPGQNQTLQLPLSEPGAYNAVIVAFDAAGEAQNAASASFTVTAGGASSDFTNYGTGAIIDGWITSLWKFGDAGTTYDQLPWAVPVQKHKTQPGIYKLKSPWTQPDAIVVLAGLNTNTTPCDIIVNIEDPEIPYIEPQLSGFANTAAYAQKFGAEFYISDLPGYYVAAGNEPSAVKKAGKNNSTFDAESEVMTIPTCLWGKSLSEEDYGYNWKSNPVAMIALNDSEAEGVVAKIQKYNKLKNLYRTKQILAPLTQKTVKNIAFPTKKIDVKKTIIRLSK